MRRNIGQTERATQKNHVIARSLSGWVNRALRHRLQHNRQPSGRL